jgi:hypothetical protein
MNRRGFLTSLAALATTALVPSIPSIPIPDIRILLKLTMNSMYGKFRGNECITSVGTKKEVLTELQRFKGGIYEENNPRIKTRTYDIHSVYPHKLVAGYYDTDM